LQKFGYRAWAYSDRNQIVEDRDSIVGHSTETVVGIDADHRGMCKFESRENGGYQMVLGAIEDYVKEAKMQPGFAEGSMLSYLSLSNLFSTGLA
jgi:hypothetical protein